MTDLLTQLVGTALAAGSGGVAAWVVIRVDVALAKQTAEKAEESCQRAHVRLDDHVEKHHTGARQ